VKAQTGSERSKQRRMRIYATVDSIPEGRVSTYGRIAEEAGIARGARQVDAALRDLPGDRKIPWHRVINAAGKISHGSPAQAALQRRLLEREGVTMSEAGKVDLASYVWP
jgi:methylated-DNA-protein-cysteine methyltransferase related protein